MGRDGKGREGWMAFGVLLSFLFFSSLGHCCSFSGGGDEWGRCRRERRRARDRPGGEFGPGTMASGYLRFVGLWDCMDNIVYQAYYYFRNSRGSSSCIFLLYYRTV
ncbi:hypothetical protein BZA05DRAFT_386439 [Tricharina praecox]|uniref:uncharacterized protein n=1 Tax=Tricharina praecox TaxID=43433 RepID=UPI00221E5569|nr:uncharacterized protein BZA05DRAFT_386439 [Tricharina praecox]KAI5856871.1 hypothetical protein BZA05DRAFT_386439 [Tricharina praecox]